jgi:hypothetical protein
LLTRTAQGKNVVSVKGGCLEGLDYKTAIHIWTKSAMVPIPEGAESHDGEPSESEFSSSQEALDQPMDDPGFLTGSGGFPEAQPTEEIQALGKIRGACELSGI